MIKAATELLQLGRGVEMRNIKKDFTPAIFWIGYLFLLIGFIEIALWIAR